MHFYKATYLPHDRVLIKELQGDPAEEVKMLNGVLVYAIVEATDLVHAEVKARKIGYQVEHGIYKAP